MSNNIYALTGIGLAVFGFELIEAPSASAEDACANPQETCGAMIDQNCLSVRVGAGALAAAPSDGAQCENQFVRYRECLANVALRCDPAAAAAAAPTGGACAPALEERLWDTVKDSTDPGELQIFIDRCPNSPFALIAERRIASRSAPAVPQPTAAPTPAPAATIFTPTGADYLEAQRELRRLGYYRSALDGDWGRGSQTAMRIFQREQGLTQDGQLTLESLTALRAAPTPAVAPAQTGYIGQYRGTWRSTSFLGGSGTSEFRAISYDPATGALEGRLGIEYNGVVSAGVVKGTLTPSSGGSMKGILRAPDGSGWDASLSFNPSTGYDVFGGTFYSVPLPGTWGVTQEGSFQIRRVR